MHAVQCGSSIGGRRALSSVLGGLVQRCGWLVQLHAVCGWSLSERVRFEQLWLVPLRHLLPFWHRFSAVVPRRIVEQRHWRRVAGHLRGVRRRPVLSVWLQPTRQLHAGTLLPAQRVVPHPVPCRLVRRRSWQLVVCALSAGSASAHSASSECVLCVLGEEATPVEPGATQCSPCPALTLAAAPDVCSVCTSVGCTGGPQCAVGYQGDLCSECTAGFFVQRQVQAGMALACALCPPISGELIALLVFVLLLVAAVLVQLNSSSAAQSLLVPLGIAASNVQLLSFLALVDLHWSHGTALFLRTSTSLISLHVQGLSVESACFITYPAAFVAALVAPGAFAVLVAILSISKRGARNDACRRRLSALLPVVLRALLSFLSLAYVEVAWQAWSVFDCTSIASSRRVREYVQLECGSGAWWQYAGPAIAAMMLYVGGVPLVLWALVRRSDTDELLGTAVTCLRTERRGWFVGQLLWRLAAMLTLRLFFGHTGVQCALLALLFAVRPLYVTVGAPYCDRRYLRQEQLHACLSAFVFACGVVSWACKVSGSGEDALFVMVVLALCMHASCAAYFARYAWKEQHRQRQKDHSETSEADPQEAKLPVELSDIRNALQQPLLTPH